MLSPSLRKAAVLISALDERTADAVLQQMSAEDAAKVRSALIQLDEIPADEQQHVLAEFFHQQSAPASPAPNEDGDVSLEIDPQLEQAVDAVPSPAPPVASRDEPSFDFLQHVEPKALAAVLRGEHPQTVAVVVAQLTAERAAVVLQELPSALATDALERIAWLDQLSPEILADLAHGLRQQLAPHIRTAQAEPESLAHVTAVLSAMDFRQRERVVMQLAQRNTALVERLGLFAADAPPADPSQVVSLRYRLESGNDRSTEDEKKKVSRRTEASDGVMDESWLIFGDLIHLSDAALRSVFAAAEPDVALLALTGAEPRLIARILRKIPTREAAVLRQRLEHPGPLRVRDVEQAQAALAAIASRLAHEGTITLPPSVGFAAAV
jgi:flagellar motor switch protein FliG